MLPVHVAQSPVVLMVLFQDLLRPHIMKDKTPMQQADLWSS